MLSIIDYRPLAEKCKRIRHPDARIPLQTAGCGTSTRKITHTNQHTACQRETPRRRRPKDVKKCDTRLRKKVSKRYVDRGLCCQSQSRLAARWVVVSVHHQALVVRADVGKPPTRCPSGRGRSGRDCYRANVDAQKQHPDQGACPGRAGRSRGVAALSRNESNASTIATAGIGRYRDVLIAPHYARCRPGSKGPKRGRYAGGIKISRAVWHVASHVWTSILGGLNVDVRRAMGAIRATTRQAEHGHVASCAGFVAPLTGRSHSR